jgi:hypothetical protein
LGSPRLRGGGDGDMEWLACDVSEVCVRVMLWSLAFWMISSFPAVIRRGMRRYKEMFLGVGDE